MPRATYDTLLETVHASAAFEVLRAGLVLGIFEALVSGSTRIAEIPQKLSIEPVRAQILVEALLGLGLLERETDGELRNCLPIAEIIQRGELPVLIALVRFQAEIVALGQQNFTNSLIDNRNTGLRYFPGEGDTLYHRLESDPRLQRVFFEYMQTYTRYVSSALLQAQDFSSYRRILDVGGGGGALAVKLAEAYPAVEVTLLDIDFARPSFDEEMAAFAARTRVKFYSADMHAEEFPTGFDLVIFAHQLVIWSPAQNMELLRKARTALVPGGSVMICSSMVDDDRSGPLMALLDAIYFQSVAAGEGQIYSFSSYREWLSEVGFSEINTRRLSTWTPHGLVVANKA